MIYFGKWILYEILILVSIVKVYWNTAMLICLYIVFSHPKTPELRSGNQNQMARKA